MKTLKIVMKNEENSYKKYSLFRHEYPDETKLSHLKKIIIEARKNYLKKNPNDKRKIIKICFVKRKFPNLGIWKKFEMREIREAEEFAYLGGIAIHMMGKADRFLEGKTLNIHKAFKGKIFAHLFGPTTEILTKEATSIGCKKNWIQHPGNLNRMHFDITGGILAKALKKCGYETVFEKTS